MRFALLLLVACACAPRACAMIDNTRHLVAGCSWGPHYVGQLQGITVHVAPDCPKFDTGTLLRAFEAAGPRGVGVNGPGWETAAWLGVQEPLRAWYPACAVVMPSRETLAILDFKDAFSVWMASHADLAPHTPATFASLDDAVYPLFLKLDVHALGSQGINLVQTRAEAEALLAAHPGTQPHLLQEAILSVDEWSIKFVAFQGRLLQIGQARRRQSGGLKRRPNRSFAHVDCAPSTAAVHPAARQQDAGHHAAGRRQSHPQPGELHRHARGCAGVVAAGQHRRALQLQRHRQPAIQGRGERRGEGDRGKGRGVNCLSRVVSLSLTHALKVNPRLGGGFHQARLAARPWRPWWGCSAATAAGVALTRRSMSADARRL